MRRCWPIVLLLLLIIGPVNAKGGPSQAWKLELDGIGASAASPSVGLAISSGSRVVLVSKEGYAKWDWTAEDSVNHMAFDARGNLYITYSDEIAKLDASGALQWKRDTYSHAYSLDVLPDGRPVLGYDKGVLCFDEDGKKAWEHYAQEECDTWVPKAPGPVRSLLFLDTYRLLILGEVFDASDQERAYGYDYINIVDARDGYTDRQFDAIKPNDIVQIIKLGPKSVMVSAEPAGLVGWNTVDVNALDWVSKGIAPLYMAAGPEGTALLVGEDGLSLTLLDTEDGTHIKSGRLMQRAAGNPVYLEGMFIVPTQDGIEILGPDIVKVGSVVIEGYGDKAGILGVNDGFYFVGDDLVAKFGF